MCISNNLIHFHANRLFYKSITCLTSVAPFNACSQFTNVLFFTNSLEQIFLTLTTLRTCPLHIRAHHNGNFVRVRDIDGRTLYLSTSSDICIETCTVCMDVCMLNLIYLLFVSFINFPIDFCIFKFQSIYENL